MTDSERQPGSEPMPAASQQQWAWARPQPALQPVETEPLEYHRLLRGVQGYRWWKPLVLLLVAGCYFGVFTVALVLAFTPVMAMDPEYMNSLLDGSVPMLDTQHPVSVAISLLSIIIMLPAVLLAMLTLGMRPMGRIWSVACRIRWGLLGRLFGAAVVAIVAMNAFGIGIDVMLHPEPLSPSPFDVRDFDREAAFVSLVLVLLLVPLQSLTEEVVFRGLFMQVLGSWLKNPWFAILIPSVGFALAHIYDVWGLAAVGVMGGVAAWLTWRTGGLEAAIALHIVNNLIAFGFMLSGVTGETGQTSGSSGPLGVVSEVIGLALFAWLALRIFAKGGHGRSRIDVQMLPVPAGAGAAVPEAPETSAPGSEGERRDG